MEDVAIRIAITSAFREWTLDRATVAQLVNEDAADMLRANVTRCITSVPFMIAVFAHYGIGGKESKCVALVDADCLVKNFNEQTLERLADFPEGMTPVFEITNELTFLRMSMFNKNSLAATVSSPVAAEVEYCGKVYKGGREITLPRDVTKFSLVASRVGSIGAKSSSLRSLNMKNSNVFSTIPPVYRELADAGDYEHNAKIIQSSVRPYIMRETAALNATPIPQTEGGTW